MTSNIGVRQLKEFGDGVGFATATRMENADENNKAVIEKALKRTFSPEFLNRIDDIITFNSLNDENVEIKQLTYETQIAIKKPLDIQAYRGCISSIFINETNIFLLNLILLKSFSSSEVGLTSVLTVSPKSYKIKPGIIVSMSIK